MYVLVVKLVLKIYVIYFKNIFIFILLLGFKINKKFNYYFIVYINKFNNVVGLFIL